MGPVPWRSKDRTEKSPLKLLIWTALAGLIIGLLGIGQLLEDQLRIARNGLHMHKASGDIVFVGIDDKSLKQTGRWPWPRTTHAKLVENLTKSGAKRIYFDIMFETPSTVADDKQLAQAIARSGRVTLAARSQLGDRGLNDDLVGPLPTLAGQAQLASIQWEYNYQNAIWELPKSGRIGRATIPTFAVAMSGKTSAKDGTFPVDYSLDFTTVPHVSASDVLAGPPVDAIRGKDVIVGADAAVLGDRFFVPGVGRMPGAYVHIAGAETLKSGIPTLIGWPIAFLLALSASYLAIKTKSWRRQNVLLGTFVFFLLVGPIPLEAHLIMVDVAPAVLVSLALWTGLLWRHFKADGITNAVSGLPNLTALKAYRQGRDQALVAARVLNYAEIVASLPAEAERTLVEQIVGRLTVGSSEKMTYHGDGGLFAWFEEPKLPFGHHIDALHSLFRNPVRVNGQAIDLSVAFGVEIGSGRTLANRLASALMAAEEAAHDGLKWKIYDPEKLSNASWKLSLLSRLDEAIDNGEVWVAYQPKLDLRTRTIVGAEALARWTHPEKGPIAASEFIAAAEQHDRIGKLTDFVLDEAIRAAAVINAKIEGFHVAVNLSARLLGEKSFELELTELLLKHRLDPRLLTLELTETSALGSGEALHTLSRLRDLGVAISIDDYGTGLSTLDYLKKVPAGEIKIDQSFVKSMMENRSDRVMVQSTIALAHSLGRTVVAEGVENAETLDALIEMKCDVAQGFVIGRPTSFESFVRRLAADKKRSVA